MNNTNASPAAGRSAPTSPSNVTRPHVLLVHHDADLYGADQSLLRLTRALLADRWQPIVLLPHHGPLLPLLQAAGAEVHIGPVVKLTQRSLRPRGLLAMPMLIWRSLRFISSAVAGRHVALVYSNSIAALGGALWAVRHGLPKVWHVREIVTTPRLAATGFPWLLRALGGWCVCNSGPTRDWLTAAQPVLATRSNVIWNGLEDDLPAPLDLAARVQVLRRSLGIDPDDLVVTLVGRINRWKGQGVLIDAAASLVAAGVVGVRFLIVGDVADGQHGFREALLAKVAAAGLQREVLFLGFTAEVDVVWAASDIAAVPSIEPEPFGRVAIEAMAHELPVVAAGHGGLTEIVEHERTGLLVAPGNAQALADALQRLLADVDLRRRFGRAGRERQRAVFTQRRHDEQVLALLDQLVTTH